MNSYFCDDFYGILWASQICHLFLSFYFDCAFAQVLLLHEVHLVYKI